jgi:hypothetical protein
MPDGFDAEGYYDETKDLAFFERLKKSDPKLYEELMKAIEPFGQPSNPNEESESKNKSLNP